MEQKLLPYTSDNLAFAMLQSLTQGIPLAELIELEQRTPYDVFNDLGIDIVAVLERVYTQQPQEEN